MEYVLETRALCKQYKHFKALNDLNMHVPKGIHIWICGEKRSR